MAVAIAGAGPPITLAVVGLWSVLCRFVDIPWNLPTALVALALTPAVCLLGAVDRPSYAAARTVGRP